MILQVSLDRWSGRLERFYDNNNMHTYINRNTGGEMTKPGEVISILAGILLLAALGALFILTVITILEKL